MSMNGYYYDRSESIHGGHCDLMGNYYRSDSKVNAGQGHYDLMGNYYRSESIMNADYYDLMICNYYWSEYDLMGNYHRSNSIMNDGRYYLMGHYYYDRSGGGGGEGIDLISDLPEPIIHHIMSFLPERDLSTTLVLSKHFYHLWRSYPRIVFNQFFSCIGARLFLYYVKDSIQRRRLNTDLERFYLKLDFGDNFDSKIDEIVQFAQENNVHELELKLLVKEESLRYELSEGFSPRSLTYLKLSGLKFDIDWLISVCPLLKSLILSKCSTFSETKMIKKNASHRRSPLTMLSFSHVNITDKWIEEHVPMFLNLKILVLKRCIKLRNIRVMNKNVERFDVLDYFVLESIEVVAPYLRSLYLCSNACVTGIWLMAQVCSSHHLQNLKLDECPGLRNIEIYNCKLQHLEILDCENVDEIAVDAKNLEYFVYRGDVTIFRLMNSPKLGNSRIELRQRSQIVAIDEWNGMRNLLSFFSHCETLTLVGCSNKDFIIPEDIRASRLRPLFDVKHLRLETQNSMIKTEKSIVIDTELVDNLLWLVPHPESLCFVESKKEKIIKFHYKEEKEIRDDYCCRGLRIKCWRDDCKYVELQNFEDGDDDEDQLFTYFLVNLQ